MTRNIHTRLLQCEAELAREREATEELRRSLLATSELGIVERERFEGRVRELREALETIDVEVTEVGEFTPEAARALREALVGLPE